MTKPKPDKPVASVTTSNVSLISKRPQIEPRTVTHTAEPLMPIDVDSLGWSCDSCTRDNVAECVACASCGLGRHDSEVLCGGDNPNVEPEASRLQRAYDEARFIVDFSFGVSVVPGYETFAITDLDEHIQAASIPLSNDSYSEMLIVNLFGCNYQAKAALQGWSMSHHGCAVEVFHESYQGRYNNCGQIGAGVMSVLQRRDWTWNLDECFDAEMKVVANACNSNVADRAATDDLDVTALIADQIGTDVGLDGGKVIARSFLETVHITTRWHLRLRAGEQPDPLAIIMNTDTDSQPGRGLGHWVAVVLRRNGRAIPSQPTDLISTTVADSAPTSAVADSAPTSAVADSAPAVMDSAPTTVVMDSTPTPAVSAPTTVVMDSAPTSAVMDSAPTSAVMDSAPTTVGMDSAPTSAVMDSAPTTVVMDSAPTSAVMDSAPTTVGMDSAPTSAVMDSAPTTIVSAPTTAAMDSAPTTAVMDSAPTTALMNSTDTELVSSTGKYIATFASKQGMWRISDAKKKSIGSRKKRDAAVADLYALELGQHKSQKHTKAKDQLAEQAKRHQTQRMLSRPARPEFHTDVRQGDWKPGLGRGNKLPPPPVPRKKRALPPSIIKSFSPTKTADGLIKSGCTSVKKLRASLSLMVHHCKNLKAQLGVATSKIAHLSRILAPMSSRIDQQTSHGCCNATCTNAVCSLVSHSSSKSKLVRELIGEGYNLADSGRSLRRHRLCVMTALEKACGEDKLKQYEVACAIKDLFKQRTQKKEAKADISRSVILEGLEATFAIISSRRNGSNRYTSHDRIVREALCTAIMMCKPDGVTINSMRAALGEVVDWQALKNGLEQAAAFKKGTRDLVEWDETSRGKYPVDWEKFVKECWMSTTRESERKSDEKYCRTEKKWYRVRWLEQKLQDVLAWMRAEGMKRFGEGFHLSSFKMKNLMPWYTRKPGRETCMCRYHMKFDHFCDALRRWKQAVSQDLTPEQTKACTTAPANAQEMRQFLQCEKVGGLYPAECSMRHRLCCRKCANKFDSLISNAERSVRPMINFQRWSDVPYYCKDGRVLKTFDFVDSGPCSIEDFESEFRECIIEHLPHHTRAQLADQEWDYLWNHVHEFPNSVACVTDFSNSYLHKHKYEHMQQFWCEVSSTLLGCVMRIPIDNLSDAHMPADEKARLKQLLSNEGLPPLVTITHVLVTPNPHHDTAAVQHFWKEKLYPWMWENTVGLEGGCMFVRSDNCGGQFKSGRHFRFISEHSSLPHSKGMRLLWSHFESCHGKDLSGTRASLLLSALLLLALD
jgi:hypothetical protein